MIPGGYAPDRLRMRHAIVDLIREAIAASIPVGAVGHGPQVLISADAIDGRTVTCWPSIAIDVTNAGGLYVDRPVVEDRGIITARKLDDVGPVDTILAPPPCTRLDPRGEASRESAQAHRIRISGHAGDLAVQTTGLTRAFGSFRAVDGIDLAVPAGSFYGFLGPNGAGKSTTIKCLTGLLRPTAGTMRILGVDPLADPVAVKRRIGVVPEDLALFDRLTGEETLTFVAQVHGIDAIDDETALGGPACRSWI